MAKTQQPYRTTREAARELGVTHPTVSRWLARLGLVPVMVGNTRMIDARTMGRLRAIRDRDSRRLPVPA